MEEFAGLLILGSRSLDLCFFNQVNSGILILGPMASRVLLMDQATSDFEARVSNL